MSTVAQVPPPAGSFLDRVGQGDGVYTDCFEAAIAGDVSFADYITAFYTTPLFRCERLILRFFAGAPSTDAEARRVGTGEADRFALWHMVERGENQLLMRAGRTSSWFMLVPGSTAQGIGTKLMFGSVVMPVIDRKTGQARLGLGFESLLWPHIFYSRQLLSAARRRLLRA
ncbi:hypothetical protein EI983_17870 [Roseovarius faecimaris]|uniref:DUF2867 domain-containing protein n=1 Tax=Roseovarius faecimaris TaxID=2494550 RepID=A0A6I6IUX4_9RHOB|nr:hypothetical protein [Roseovarius faecimaris]QGY00033.1 hypothetical protein EI983_17870 [Roseovarius faecimaris]